MAGRVRVQNGSEPTNDWRAGNLAADNVQATATRGAVPVTSAAAGPGSRNVLTGFVATIVGGTSAPSAATLSVSVIDGATAGTTYVLGPIAIGMPGVAGATNGIAMSGLWERGSPNTAMTIEFSIAGGSSTIESVWMTGTTE